VGEVDVGTAEDVCVTVVLNTAVVAGLVSLYSEVDMPKGTTGHHSISSTDLPELELAETYRLDTPPKVIEPILLWYLDEEDEALLVLEVVVAVLVLFRGGGARASPNTGQDICGFVKTDSRNEGRYRVRDVGLAVEEAAVDVDVLEGELLDPLLPSNRLLANMLRRGKPSPTIPDIS
jgi:hypothetical protein